VGKKEDDIDEIKDLVFYKVKAIW